jgi:hypothetical protein
MINYNKINKYFLLLLIFSTSSLLPADNKPNQDKELATLLSLLAGGGKPHKPQTLADALQQGLYSGLSTGVSSGVSKTIDGMASGLFMGAGKLIVSYYKKWYPKSSHRDSLCNYALLHAKNNLLADLFTVYLTNNQEEQTKTSRADEYAAEAGQQKEVFSQERVPLNPFAWIRERAPLVRILALFEDEFKAAPEVYKKELRFHSEKDLIFIKELCASLVDNLLCLREIVESSQSVEQLRDAKKNIIRYFNISLCTLLSDLASKVDTEGALGSKLTWQRLGGHSGDQALLAALSGIGKS